MSFVSCEAILFTVFFEIHIFRWKPFYPMLASIGQLNMEVQNWKSHQKLFSLEPPHFRVEFPTSESLSIADCDKPLSWTVSLNSVDLRLLSSFFAKVIKVIHQAVPHICGQVTESSSRVKESYVPIVTAS